MELLSAYQPNSVISSTLNLKAGKKVIAIKDVLHFVPQKGAQEHSHIVFPQGNIVQVNIEC